MTEPEDERAIDRIDRKLGMAWSRTGGTIAALIGIAMLLAGLSGDGLLDRWPLLLGAALMLAIARLAFRSRQGLSDLLDEGPSRRRD